MPERHACFCLGTVAQAKMSANVCVGPAAAKPCAKTGLWPKSRTNEYNLIFVNGALNVAIVANQINLEGDRYEN